MLSIFHKVSNECSRITTIQYSTSFASSIKLLGKNLRQPIFNIYGFVRFADEIVDTFHSYNKLELLNEFEKETYESINRGISLNPILHSFQRTVNEYKINQELIAAFFKSMRIDLHKKTYDVSSYAEYIYGSAEVVGLMCLHVFCQGNLEMYNSLKEPARSLGAAFQKVNFLRDIKADFEGMDRIYFPQTDFNNFTQGQKQKIEEDIAQDFKHAYEGILQLPASSRFGVYVAYKYYLSLFKKIKQTQPKQILQSRIRIPNYQKAFIVVRAGVKNQLRLI
jgi:15-cis-phytoene synthase